MLRRVDYSSPHAVPPPKGTPARDSFIAEPVELCLTDPGRPTANISRCGAVVISGIVALPRLSLMDELTNDCRAAATLAAQLAPEDVRVGDYVAVLAEVGEYPSFLWDLDAAALPPCEPVRIVWKASDQGRPYKVQAVCLPFVLLKASNGSCRTRDLRQCRLARLDPTFAKKVWKARRKARRKAQGTPDREQPAFGA